jgi:hypothetical protein
VLLSGGVVVYESNFIRRPRRLVFRFGKVPSIRLPRCTIGAALEILAENDLVDCLEVVLTHACASTRRLSPECDLRT